MCFSATASFTSSAVIGGIGVAGVANVVALTITLIVLAAAFTSIWCFAAAILSVLTLLFFRRTRRRSPEISSSPSPSPAVQHR